MKYKTYFFIRLHVVVNYNLLEEEYKFQFMLIFITNNSGNAL